MEFVVRKEKLLLEEFAVHLLDKAPMDFAVKWVVDLWKADVVWSLEFQEPNVVQTEKMRQENVAYLLKELWMVRVVAMVGIIKDVVVKLDKEKAMESVVQLDKRKVMASVAQMEKDMWAANVVGKHSFP